MKLVYIANVRLPSQKAHGIQIMEMCQAFSHLGVEVELVIRNSNTEIKDDVFKFYDIEPVFTIRKLWCLDTVHWGKAGFLFELLTFTISVFYYSFGKNSIFYTRDEIVALMLKVMGKKVIWEAHMGQKNIVIKKLVSLNTKIVGITGALKDLYVKMGSKEENILVAPDGADIDRFDINLSRDEARKQLNLPLDKLIVLYKGSLISWKGVDTLIKSLSYIKNSNIVVVTIGGTKEEIEKLKELGEPKNLKMIGRVPRVETPIYQKAADILALPNSGKEEISRLYTSPMKLFGYMAGGVPIVASDLPSLREVLNEANAFFFTPDVPESLAKEIENVLANYEEAKSRARRALEEVRVYSWSNRARNIMNFIKS